MANEQRGGRSHSGEAVGSPPSPCGQLGAPVGVVGLAVVGVERECRGGNDGYHDGGGSGGHSGHDSGGLYGGDSGRGGGYYGDRDGDSRA